MESVWKVFRLEKFIDIRSLGVNFGSVSTRIKKMCEQVLCECVPWQWDLLVHSAWVHGRDKGKQGDIMHSAWVHRRDWKVSKTTMTKTYSNENRTWRQTRTALGGVQPPAQEKQQRHYWKWVSTPVSIHLVYLNPILLMKFMNVKVLIVSKVVAFL